MDVTIEQESVNEDLGRKRVTASLSYSGETPSRSDVRSALQGEVAGGHIVVRSIRSNYGSASATVVALVYDDEDVMREVEQAYVLERHGSDAEDETDASDEEE